MTREKISRGRGGALEMARTKGNPRCRDGCQREIAKITGLCTPERQKIEVIREGETLRLRDVLVSA